MQQRCDLSFYFIPIQEKCNALKEFYSDAIQGHDPSLFFILSRILFLSSEWDHVGQLSWWPINFGIFVFENLKMWIANFNRLKTCSTAYGTKIGKLQF